MKTVEINEHKKQYTDLLPGETAESRPTIPLYQSCGFVYSHRVKVFSPITPTTRLSNAMNSLST